jgi:diaminopimelate epimerase
MHLAFSKYEGLGNDFVIVDTSEVAPPGVEQAVRICDRHLGVGADGVLLVSSDGPRVRMQVINADGSRPEMCGNGIRCVALHLRNLGRVSDELAIETDSGPHRCRVLSAGESGVVEVSMRAAGLLPAEVPFAGEGPMLDEPLQVGERTLRVTAVSMGNPHAVTFEDVGGAKLELGPLLRAHERFPSGANAGFARMLAPDRIELSVLERGVGWTRACGTGACAAAVAAVETGRARRGKPIEVSLPGGTLRIVVGQRGEPISMTGPARHVFDGRLELS